MEHHFAGRREYLLPKVREILELRDRAVSERGLTSISQLQRRTHRLLANIRFIQGYLFEMRELTSRCNVPKGVCMRFSVGYRELAAFDETPSQYLEIEEDS